MITINPDQHRWRCFCPRCKRYIMVYGIDYTEQVEDMLTVWSTLEELQRIDVYLDQPQGERVCGDCIVEAMQQTGTAFDLSMVYALVRRDVLMHSLYLNSYFVRPVDK